MDASDLPVINLGRNTNVDLPTEVLELLVEYYCNAYEYTFMTVSNIHTSSEDSIVILSKAVD